ncbi:phosphoglycerate mutase-like protein [Gloeophyllum trabeum ATCC 11539]|uniref:Phosphoglycerate mutase-like protein n=1 Tax=Gloeophyllum trabeum (strain ATCC 11539 / FP-39264 / Madison 617) TaxID=670483 RepID=S7QM61_GLOTA|nr:phosphoglycerate mutase-like protein [Gloeophyllum trabeum ATCC 11539]EPQ60548.1 phosphoglycerate mutase-like protein [Gloeophyllum trabeum ATCC 11539]
MLLAALPLLFAVASAALVKPVDPPASNYAGATSSAVFPPPGASGSALASYFPGASEVGYPGPTPTGDEAAAIETAPPSYMESVYPLSDPLPSGPETPGFDVIRYWGNLSPWYSVPSAAQGLPYASPQVPTNCSITQVHLLHRHGARYPTSGSGPANFAAKLHASVVNGTGFNASGALAFLASWEYKLGAEILTPFGREQMYDLGVGFRVKYGKLLKGFTQLPVFRTTSEDRMLNSALNFAAGFFGAQTFTQDYYQSIIIEASGYNNTLAPSNACPNNNGPIGSIGDSLENDWIAIYLTPALERISPFLPGLNLTVSDIYSMQQLCAYETVALGFSDFCGLFTQEEWEGYEYSNDISFWYNNGPGNPTSAAMGLGWVGELVSRLTQEPITGPLAEVNTTLANDATFPLNQPIYVDASHDTVISAILTTMNMTSMTRTGPLPTDHIPYDRSYIVSQIAPFGSNLVGQVLSCPASSTPTHIRWILNDAVLPLTGIQGCAEDANGLCELSTFIAAYKQRLTEVDYDFDCYASYTTPSPDAILDGQFPAYLRNGTV